VVHSSDGTHYLLQEGRSWRLVPDRISDFELATRTSLGKFVGAIPPQLQLAAQPVASAPAPAASTSSSSRLLAQRLNSQIPSRYLQATDHAARALRNVEKHKIFVDAEDACIFYELHVDHAVNVVPVAEWYHLDGDRITSIRTILDMAPFTSRRPSVPADRAAESAPAAYTDKAAGFLSHAQQSHANQR
jgi:hypothetical protein